MLRYLTFTLVALAVHAASTCAAAAAAVAPGRVAFSVAAQTPVSHVDAGGATQAVALPDGGAVMLVPHFRQIVAVRVRADGSLDGSFGSGGIARLAAPGGHFDPVQILRQPDGRLLLVGAGPTQRFVLVRLTPAGAADLSFGVGGFTILDLQLGCANCAPAALAPDESTILTGSTGTLATATAPAARRWVVQRLMPTGAVDPAFGSAVLAGQAGFGTVVRPNGQIVVIGGDGGERKLVGLTAAGATDTSFHGGQPLTAPIRGAFRLQLGDGGAVDVVGDESLLRYTAAGEPVASFGANGVVAIGPAGVLPVLMFPVPGGGTMLFRSLAYAPSTPSSPRIRVQHVSPNGAVVATRNLAPAFGGGVANYREFVEQNSFRATAVARPDGSLLAVGGISVVRYTGEGSGFSAGLVAVAALTAQFGLDATFGGQQEHALARVQVPRQRARTAVRRMRVIARVTASGPGLVLLRVRDGRRRILAESIEAVFAAGTATAQVRLTELGRRLLRRGGSPRVWVGHDFRDVLTGRDRGVAAGRLR